MPRTFATGVASNRGYCRGQPWISPRTTVDIAADMATDMSVEIRSNIRGLPWQAVACRGRARGAAPLATDMSAGVREKVK